MYGNVAVIKQKPIVHHPLHKYVKQEYAERITYTHNSVSNPKYPLKPKKIVPESSKIRFMVIGNFLCKEFIECKEIVDLFHRYKKNFEPPIIRGVTATEWPEVWRDLKARFGGDTFCIQSEVAVFMNGNILGGDKELKKYLQQNYTFNITIDYYTKAVQEFLNRVRASGRSHAYMHIAIDGTYAGTFIFMLYTDITPVTAENFLRLCNLKKGGYSGTPIHRVVKDGWVQGGGYGLKSLKMSCENYIVPKDQRGVLCMANDGRNCDNSTQFFILLQPANWMAHRYVGFGQLIDGEEMLRKLEALPTYYESPLNDVIIMDSGVLNLECHGIMPTVGTNEYVELHIEDLINLGETFYNELMERVFMEIKFREVTRLHKEQKGEGGEETGIHETKRFIKNKKDMEEQLHRNKIDTEIEIEEGNLEYDVEVYEPEEYSYKHVSLVSSSIVIKETKPYYVAMTDVPYPGEKDSVFDFKRFLKGYYCLESDLETKKEEEPPELEEKEDGKEKGEGEETQEGKEIKEATSEVKDVQSKIKTEISEIKPERSIFEKTIVAIEKENIVPVSVETSSLSSYSFDFSLDSDEEEEIKSYLRLFVDRVSFAGDIIRQISKGGEKGRKLKRNVPTLDFLTRLRLSTASKSVPKKVMITEPELSMPLDSESRPKIKRRQTGFIRQQFDYDDDDDDDDDDHDRDDNDYHGRRSRAKEGGVGVKINPPGETTAQKIARRQTGITQPGVEEHKPRESVLKRLYDDVIDDDSDEKLPTLKEFKPRSEYKKKTTLLTYSPPIRPTLSKESGSIRSVDGRVLCDEMMTVQHGLERKISSDYIKTIEQGHKTKKSIRSVEYARTRPMLTVAEYQAKNLLYEQQQQQLKEEEEQQRLQQEEKRLLLIQLQQQRQKEEEEEEQRQQMLQQQQLLLIQQQLEEEIQELAPEEEEEEQQEQELKEEQEGEQDDED